MGDLAKTPPSSGGAPICKNSARAKKILALTRTTLVPHSYSTRTPLVGGLILHNSEEGGEKVPTGPGTSGAGGRGRQSHVWHEALAKLTVKRVVVHRKLRQ